MVGGNNDGKCIVVTMMEMVFGGNNDGRVVMLESRKWLMMESGK